MPAKKPTPFSPEGRRAAERIRTIFYAIAAANIVIAAIVMWQRQAHKDHAETPAKPVTAEEAAAKRAPDTERDRDRGDKHSGSDAPGK